MRHFLWPAPHELTKDTGTSRQRDATTRANKRNPGGNADWVSPPCASPCCMQASPVTAQPSFSPSCPPDSPRPRRRRWRGQFSQPAARADATPHGTSPTEQICFRVLSSAPSGGLFSGQSRPLMCHLPRLTCRAAFLCVHLPDLSPRPLLSRLPEGKCSKYPLPTWWPKIPGGLVQQPKLPCNP